MPFSPVPGPRILARDASCAAALREQALAFARDSAASSLHVLFDADTGPWTRHGLLLREGVQFHWRNRHYRDFEAFLAALQRGQAQEDPPGAPPRR